MSCKPARALLAALLTVVGLVCAMLLLLHPPAAPMLAQAPADHHIYADTLASGWQDWSWDTAVDYGQTGMVYSGTQAIAVTYTVGYGGLQVGYHGAYLDVSEYDTLRFWVHGGSVGSQNIQVQLNGSLTYPITPTAGTWTQVDLSLLPLGDSRSLYNVIWWNPTASAQPAFYLDGIVLVATGEPPDPPPVTEGPALSVDASADRHPISPYIYGMNSASEPLAAELDLPVNRRGGNSTTRYNWQNNTHNIGLDWYFENVPDARDTQRDLPAGSVADLFVEQNRRTGTESLLTVPLIGWTPKSDTALRHPYDCGFKVSVYGAQQDTDSVWDPDCGDGILPNGSPITGNNPLDTSMPITPTFVQDWVSHLQTEYGTAAEGGVRFYALDNEPMLWPYTHRDVHPAMTTYAEMLSRTVDYAAALKTVDPAAQTLGPVVWGWCAYFYSAADGCVPGDDYHGHGDAPFLEWYLQHMQAYEQQHGQRLLDYLDLHIYPQVNGVFSENLGNPVVQEARLGSTRQLWDPTYVHEGWIGQPVYLIPRMHAWVTDNYSGTKLAITEYNWGALGYMNGALAQADILGIFGREGPDLATLWDPPSIDQPGAYAFRIYRNYDGQESRFGDVSVRAVSGDQGKLAIYAAQRSVDYALTLVLINKTADALTSTLTLSGTTPIGPAQVYRYSQANLAAIVRKADQPLSGMQLTAVYPSSSITLLVVPTLPPDVVPRAYLPLVLRSLP